MLAMSLAPSLHKALAEANRDFLRNLSPAAVQAMPKLHADSYKALDHGFRARIHLATARLHILCAREASIEWSVRLAHLAEAVVDLLSCLRETPPRWAVRQSLVALLIVATTTELICLLLAVHAQRFLPTSAEAGLVARLLLDLTESQAPTSPLTKVLALASQLLTRLKTEPTLLRQLLGSDGASAEKTGERIYAVEDLIQELGSLEDLTGAWEAPEVVWRELEVVVSDSRTSLGQ